MSEKFIITTDSGSDLTPELYKQYNILPIMMEYEIDGVMYKDDPNPEKLKEFYDKIRAGAIARTTQINTDTMMTFLQELAKEGKDILHISLGSGISGTCNNCMLAAKEVADKYGIQIIIVDSLGASMADGLLCIEAAKCRDNGKTIEETAEYLNDIRHKVNVYYTTNTLTYLHRGGRVSKTSAVLGNMLGINPVLTLDPEGHLIVCDKVRGEKNTLANIIKKIQSNVISHETQTLYMSNSDCPERAELVASRIKAEVGFKDVVISRIGAIIGAHTGPGLYALFYLGKDRI